MNYDSILNYKEENVGICSMSDIRFCIYTASGFYYGYLFDYGFETESTKDFEQVKRDLISFLESK